MAQKLSIRTLPPNEVAVMRRPSSVAMLNSARFRPLSRCISEAVSDDADKGKRQGQEQRFQRVSCVHNADGNSRPAVDGSFNTYLFW